MHFTSEVVEIHKQSNPWELPQWFRIIPIWINHPIHAGLIYRRNMKCHIWIRITSIPFKMQRCYSVNRLMSDLTYVHYIWAKLIIRFAKQPNERLPFTKGIGKYSSHVRNVVLETTLYTFLNHRMCACLYFVIRNSNSPSFEKKNIKKP